MDIFGAAVVLPMITAAIVGLYSGIVIAFNIRPETVRITIPVDNNIRD